MPRPKAFENGDDIAEAHAAEADIRFLYDWDWVGAETELRKSIDLNPSFMYARNVYAQLLAAEKRFDEMLVLSEESLRMDPQSLDRSSITACCWTTSATMPRPSRQVDAR